MSLEYVRATYGVPAYVGQRITYCPYGARIEGEIRGAAGNYIRVRFGKATRLATLHPTWRIGYWEMSLNPAAKRPEPQGMEKL